MMGRTHALFGVSSLWLFTLIPIESQSVNFGVLAVCAAFGALVPDLDAGESLLKHGSIAGVKPLILPSLLLHRDLGHRGLLHSLAGWSLFVGLTLPSVFGWDWQLWMAMGLGYGSHLIADSCTRSGIRLLYPKPRHYHLLPKGWRFVTGSMAEEVLFPLLAIAVLLLMLLHLPLS